MVNRPAMARPLSDFSDERGSSLLEAAIASGLLASALVTLAQLLALAVHSNLESRTVTYATVLAGQKLEELRALTFGFDLQNSPTNDTSSDTAADPPRASGGTGLSRSPSTSLRENVPGFVDYLDRSGNKLGGGARPPSGTVYVRRWSIQPLPADPDNALIIQVLVTRTLESPVTDERDQVRIVDAHLSTVRARMLP
jgi:hypothetical protein